MLELKLKMTETEHELEEVLKSEAGLKILLRVERSRLAVEQADSIAMAQEQTKAQAGKAPLPDKAARSSSFFSRRERLYSQIRQPAPPLFLAGGREGHGRGDGVIAAAAQRESGATRSREVRGIINY